MFNLTIKEAAAVVRPLGLTLRHNAEWGEYQVYPKGQGMDAPNSYGTSDLEDALRTALCMVEDLEFKDLKSRDFTMTEQLDIETSGTHWFNEESHAVHPIGDRLYALGDNLYLVERAENPVQFKYFFSLNEALNA